MEYLEINTNGYYLNSQGALQGVRPPFGPVKTRLNL